MKLHPLVLVILISVLIGCQGKRNEVLISGKIVGEIPDKIEYTTPINGICYWGFQDSVQPDSSGSFEIKFNARQPLFIGLSVPGKPGGTIIAESGETYHVTFEPDKEEDNFQILCNSKKGQELYNSLPKTGHIQVGARKYMNDSTGSIIKQNGELTHIARSHYGNVLTLNVDKILKKLWE